MTSGYISSLNGRYTGLPSLVISSDSALQSGNHWSSLEYSRFNAWYVNFGSGNANNTNRYNEYNCRAVAALSEEIKLGWLQAFEECCIHKMTSEQCILYRLHMEEDILSLALEVELRRYKPKTSVAFVVPKPSLREIISAHFRDRIVQTWACKRLTPILEERFEKLGNTSYNCRKGFGVLACVHRVAQDIFEVSEGYTLETWVGKMDIFSCFLAIDKEVLLHHLKIFINEKYEGPDKDTLLYVCETTIKHCPHLDCVRVGNLRLWEKLPPHKSSFNNPEGKGMPPGNILIQVLNAFYLSILDEFVIQLTERCGARYIRFVDDMIIIARTKEDVIYIRNMAEIFLRDVLHHKLHPKKFHLQNSNKGVKVVGAVIKPGRIYLSNRTIGNLRDNFQKMELLCKNIVEGGLTLHRAMKIERYVAGINSIFGSLKHYAGYNVKKNVLAGLNYFWKICYVLNFQTIKIKKKYRSNTILMQEEHEYIKQNSNLYPVQQVSSVHRFNHGHNRPSNKGSRRKGNRNHSRIQAGNADLWKYCECHSQPYLS